VGGVADDPCAEPVPAPELAWLSSSPAARARPSSNCAPPSTISTCIEFCNFRSPRPASRSQVLVPALERWLEDINAQLDVPITININRAPAA